MAIPGMEIQVQVYKIKISNVQTKDEWVKRETSFSFKME